MKKCHKVSTQRQPYRQNNFSKNLGFLITYFFFHSYSQFTTFTQIQHSNKQSYMSHSLL